MATQRNYQNGSLAWEDTASPESRIRRMQQGAPSSRRNLPGMPQDPDDPEDGVPRARRRYDVPAGPWWRPATTTGRVLLAAGALTVAGILAAVWFSTAHFLQRDSRFRIAGLSNIQASGMAEVSRADILPVFGEDIGKNIFFVRLGERRKQLEQIPWVQRATVMRVLPDQLRVSIVERTPIAFARHGQQIGLVDSDGVLLTMPPSGMAQHHYSFPVVTGIDSAEPLAARRARMAVYQRLARDLDSSGQHLSQQISEIDLTDPEDARILMPEQGTDILAHFGDEQFLARYQRYKAHIGEWRQQYPRLAAVDLRYEQQVVLEMAQGSGDAPAVASSDAKTPSHSGTPSKPSAAGRAGGVTHAAPAHVQPKAHARKPEHKSQSRAEAREKKKREDARRAAASRKQHSANHSVVLHQGQ